VDRDNVTNITIRYGLDGPGIESAPTEPGTGAHPATYAKGTGLFPGLKRPRRSVNHQPYLGPSLKKEKSYISTPFLGPNDLF